MKEVLLALGWYDQPVHAGVSAYASEHGWQLDASLVRRMGRIRGEWSGDGVVAYFVGETPLKEGLVGLGCPIVTVNSNVPAPEFPSVSTHAELTVAAVFDHFRSRGFRHFGYYGRPMSLRRNLFESVVTGNGLVYHAFHTGRRNVGGEQDRLLRWLRECPTPMAVYCNNDDEGIRFVNLAVEFGFEVPGEFAVMGTDDSPLVCTSCRVHLSSLDTNLFEVGYRAAEKLDRLMNGESVEPQTLIKPKGIVERASSDTIGATSPHVRKAMAIMATDFDKGISVADVVADVGISSTGLEKAFKRELGYTPVVALRNLRMKAAANLLVSTDEKIRAIAAQVGMNNPEYFQTTFKRHFGMTPRKYRLKAKEG